MERPDRPVGRLPSAVAVAAAEGLPGDPAVLAAQPGDDLPPGDGGEVPESLAGHAGPEAGAPAPQHRVKPVGQDWQRLVDARSPADVLDLAADGAKRLLGRVGADVLPGSAWLPVTLEAPAEEVRALVEVGDQGLFR